MRLTEEQFLALPHEILSDTGGVDMSRTEAHKSLATEAKPNKLHNVPTVLDGIKFASKAESVRYRELQAMERAGLITDLRLQPVYKLFDKFTDKFGRKHRAAVYVGDFAYIENGQETCEDVKGGTATMVAVWRLKWKLAIRAYPNVKFEVVTK